MGVVADDTPANVLGARIREELDELISAAQYGDPTELIVSEIMASVDELIRRIPSSIRVLTGGLD